MLVPLPEVDFFLKIIQICSTQTSLSIEQKYNFHPFFQIYYTTDTKLLNTFFFFSSLMECFLLFSSDHVSPFKVPAMNSISAIRPLPPRQKGPRSPREESKAFFFLCATKKMASSPRFCNKTLLCVGKWKPVVKGFPLDGMAVSYPTSPGGTHTPALEKSKAQKEGQKMKYTGQRFL